MNGNNKPAETFVNIDIKAERNQTYSRLFRKFVVFTLVCSVLPLLLVGWGIYLHYSGFARNRMISDFKTQIEHHRKTIQLFLDERRSTMQLIAGSHSLEDLVRDEGLHAVFELINRDNWSFTDLGVIDDQGNHLQYVGPYDLLDKNYAQTFWFKEVMEKGIYVSEMFMGFRQEPHFVIAVTKTENGRKWILRATIDTEYFRSLVENVRIGQTGEVYLINDQGQFQTSPRFGAQIMDKAPFEVPAWHQGIQVSVRPSGHDSSGREIPSKIVSQAWLQQPRWLLMVQQDYSEALDDVNHANRLTLIFLHVGALTILIVTVLITRHMISIIRNRDLEADRLNNQLLQTGKLAAIGELSAGVAHEINNPLAIILTERQLVLDSLQYGQVSEAEFRKQLQESLLQVDIQVQRCKRITQNLLRFARRTESVIETVDINAFLREVIELIEREARTNGIRFIPELEDNLPPVLSDPSQLQQVFLNLITNAIDAHEHKPYGSIHIRTESAPDKGGLWVAFKDTGSGIPAEILSKIFDPFFTTKAVGKGTGLGLSICYSIVKRLGGQIEVESEVGQGTEFRLFLPFTPPADLQERLDESVRHLI